MFTLSVGWGSVFKQKAKLGHGRVVGPIGDQPCLVGLGIGLEVGVGGGGAQGVGS